MTYAENLRHACRIDRLDYDAEQDGKKGHRCLDCGTFIPYVITGAIFREYEATHDEAPQGAPERSEDEIGGGGKCTGDTGLG